MSYNPLAVFELKLLWNNLVLGVERGIVASSVAVYESTEYDLITHARSQLSNNFRDISRA